MTYFDDLETRSADAREAAQLSALNAQLQMVAKAANSCLQDVGKLQSLSELANLPVLRKSELGQMQKDAPPLGGIPTQNITRLFQSPGPIYEPGRSSTDWWRFSRFLHAVGIGADDVVQNTFSYHFTPAGAMFESAAMGVGAKVFPAGVGQTELQV